MAKVGTPTAQAFRFVLDGQEQQYDAYLDLVEHIDNLFVFDVRYRVQGKTEEKWTHLTSPEVYYEEINTKSNILAEVQRVLEEKLNPKIKEVFKVAGQQPTGGLPFLRWLVQVGLEEKDNVISIKPSVLQ